jgi:hypothetical protein
MDSAKLQEQISGLPCSVSCGDSLRNPTVSRGFIFGVMMKQIPLTKGQFAIVDDEDYSFLSKTKWYAEKSYYTYYARRKDSLPDKKRETKSMHREIMGYKGELEIDHINRNGLDNRKQNLRFCSREENQRNARKHRDNKSGFKGVCFDKERNKYVAQIWLGRHVVIGRYKTAIEAAKKYNEIALKQWGVFAELNVT